MAQLGFKSSTGAVREKNEDACFVIPSHNVYVVADGVGGNNAGEIASRTAVQGVAEYVTEISIDGCETDEEICSYFLDCIADINDRVYRLGHEHRENRGMATTLVLAYLRDDKAYIMNVGDSRAYLLRDNELQQITEDHTYVNELVRSGVITKEEAELLLKNDLEKAEKDAEKFSVYSKLNQTRKDVLIEMVFNLGYSRLSNFKKMFEALEKGDYDEAANQMLDSSWHKQVGKRAERLAYFMRIG